MKLTRIQLERKLTKLERKVSRLEKRLELSMINEDSACTRALNSEARAQTAEKALLKRRSRQFESHDRPKWPDGWRRLE